MAMLRKSGLMQLQKFKEFITKQGGDISKKLKKDKSVKNVLDYHIDIGDPKRLPEYQKWYNSIKDRYDDFDIRKSAKKYNI